MMEGKHVDLYRRDAWTGAWTPNGKVAAAFMADAGSVIQASYITLPHKEGECRQFEPPS